MAIYKDSITEAYLNLLKASRPDIRGWYNGIITTKIPSSMLPAIMIGITEESIDGFTNIEDQHRISMELYLILNIRKQFENSALVDAETNRALEILAGRESDYKLKTNSILHILRNNIAMGPKLKTSVGSMTTMFSKGAVAGWVEGALAIGGIVRWEAHFVQPR